jgi:hypothetical protein
MSTTGVHRQRSLNPRRHAVLHPITPLTSPHPDPRIGIHNVSPPNGEPEIFQQARGTLRSSGRYIHLFSPASKLFDFVGYLHGYTRHFSFIAPSIP